MHKVSRDNRKITRPKQSMNAESVKIVFKKALTLRPWDGPRVYRKLSELGLRFYRRYIEPLVFRRKYDTAKLIEALRAVGLEKGSTVFLHSAFSRFYNYTGDADSLIDALLEALGPDGTLAMPAFPDMRFQWDPSAVFDVKNTPTAGGYLAERFRLRQGVLRSINRNHSVCALGPNADYLVRDHHRSITSWDENSPFFRFGEVKALLLGVGIGHNLRAVSTIHCMESLLRTQYQIFHDFFPSVVTYTYIDAEGNRGEHTYLRREGLIDTKRLKPYMDSGKYIENRLSNLEIMALDARYFIARLVELGHQGITIYTSPRRQKHLFVPLKTPPLYPARGSQDP